MREKKKPLKISNNIDEGVLSIRNIGSRYLCWVCTRPIEKSWKYCPTCGTEIDWDKEID